MVIREAIQCLLGVLNHARLADATASRQLATTLTDADDNFTLQAVDPGIALGPVCIQRVVATSAS